MTKAIVLKQFLLASLFLPMMTMANIRVIGNGGGEDEMHALTVFSVVQDLANAAAYTQSQSPLSQREKELLIQALREKGVAATAWNLAFPTNGPLIRFDTQSKTIQFNINLAVANGERIDSILLRSYFNLIGLTSTESRDLAQTILPTVNWELEKFSYLSGQMIVSKVEARIAMGFSEGEQWVDLGEILRQNLSRCSAESFSIQEIHEWRREGPGLLTSISWACGHTSEYARVHIQYASDKWQVMIYGRKPSACSTRLLL